MQYKVQLYLFKPLQLLEYNSVEKRNTNNYDKFELLLSNKTFTEFLTKQVVTQSNLS